jgi:nicotinate-nucleotide adenylyltransferase
VPEHADIQRASVPIAVPFCVASGPRVLLFGGSFDPVHRGHVELTLAAARAWGGADAWSVFVPAARSPHKDRGPAADRHRVEMLRLGLRGRRNWWIWTQELQDAGLNPGEPSYWADTWAISGEVFRGERAFLIGTDQALSMHRWRRYDEFWRDAVVMRRGGLSDDGFAGAMRDTGAWGEADIGRWVSRLVDVPRVDASSTAIRAALAQPSTRAQRIEGLEPCVRSYIVERGLYSD